jgi:hypothetical protein
MQQVKEFIVEEIMNFENNLLFFSTNEIALECGNNWIEHVKTMDENRCPWGISILNLKHKHILESQK